MQLLSGLSSLDNVADGKTRKLITSATPSGAGNAVTAVSISGDSIEYKLDKTFLEKSEADKGYAHSLSFDNSKLTLKAADETVLSEVDVPGVTYTGYKTFLARPRTEYNLLGVTTTAASDTTDLYNTRISDRFTGVKYVSSTSAEGGTLYVDDKAVVTGLFYEIS